jgi:hypothetical protein
MSKLEFDTWEIAAAILILRHQREPSRCEMSYKQLTDAILASGLVRLGLKGKTEAQTVGTMLRSQRFPADKNVRLFKVVRRGHYAIADCDSALKISNVKRAVEKLKPHYFDLVFLPHKCSKEQLEGDLVMKVAVLEAENKQLRAALRKIIRIGTNARVKLQS